MRAAVLAGHSAADLETGKINESIPIGGSKAAYYAGESGIEANQGHRKLSDTHEQLGRRRGRGQVHFGAAQTPEKTNYDVLLG